MRPQFDGMACLDCKSPILFAGLKNGREMYACSNVNCRTFWVEKPEAYTRRIGGK